jgi:hypothetical protein
MIRQEDISVQRREKKDTSEVLRNTSFTTTTVPALDPGFTQIFHPMRCLETNTSKREMLFSKRINPAPMCFLHMNFVPGPGLVTGCKGSMLCILCKSGSVLICSRSDVALEHVPFGSRLTPGAT